MRITLVQTLPLILIAVIVYGMVYLWEARADEPTAPSAPAAVTVTVEPGTTDLTAVWPAVAGATSYQVRWRPHGESFPDGSEVIATTNRVSFTVASQGLWVIRVEACNAVGCSRPAAVTTAAIIINTAEKPAVRIWVENNANGRTFEIDWDDLPGYYVVKYRSKGSEEFATSPALSDSRYSIPFAKFTDSPILRVFFNCQESGERCVHLGRHPDHNRPGPFPPSPDSAPVSIPGTPGTGAAGQSTAPKSGSWEECTERPAENDWERALYGDTVRTCYRGTVSEPQPMPEDGSGGASEPAEQ